MDNIFLTGLTLPDLKAIIRSELQAVLAEHHSEASPADRLMSVDDASRFLGIAKQTLYQRVSNRTIPHSKKGKRLYFRQSELERWISEGRKATRQEISESV